MVDLSVCQPVETGFFIGDWFDIADAHHQTGWNSAYLACGPVDDEDFLPGTQLPSPPPRSD